MENIELQDLSESECETTEGGMVWAAYALAVYGALSMAVNFTEFAAGFADGVRESMARP